MSTQTPVSRDSAVDVATSCDQRLRHLPELLQEICNLNGSVVAEMVPDPHKLGQEVVDKAMLERARTLVKIVHFELDMTLEEYADLLGPEDLSK